MKSVKGLAKENKSLLVAGILPYFMEKSFAWFEKNLSKILEATKSQPFFADNLLFIEKGQTVKLSQILRRLDELGYEKVQRVEDLGEFAVRGGILDIFPINQAFPSRLEFRGNYIESIKQLPLKIKEEKAAKTRLKKKLKSQKLFSDLKGLKPGDYVVHLDHGVARFLGIEKLQITNYKLQTNSKFQFSKSQTRDYYVLEYAAGDKLYVPLGLERKLSSYVGFAEPKISRLASPLWQRTKRKVKEEAEKLAKELLKIYAQREVAERPPYLPDSEINRALQDTFPFEETADQLQAISQISQDLEGKKPMDRLVCGDSGFGKTEVALRAAVKAVNSGYQAVMICPTTILAAQHFQTFKARLKNLPIKVALLSRLQSKKEQAKIIKNLKEGKIEIIIGTHRLLSKDVAPYLFQKSRGLGLLIIDEEQRFGVKQKEKLKKLRVSLDVLSLSATPIPRTLYLALSNLRDLSFVQTPPLYRKPVKTIIAPWSEKIVKEAIEKELARGGQVYYLHNRVKTIEKAKKFLEGLKESSGKNHHWKIGVVHGRLKERELLEVMKNFREKKITVLVATTIIETGLDFPNVNTLIVADATRLGLAQAYQIRGRVGRSPVPAFAYFLYSKNLPQKAKMRLKALKEAEALGSGYQIARRDLEIRGAGNILGKEQAGNVNAVGLNLYCQMIAQAVEKLKTS